MEGKADMNSLTFFLILSFFIPTVKSAELAKEITKEITKDQWRTKLDSILPSDPDSILNEIKLELSLEQSNQAKMHLIPSLDLFHTSILTKENSAFKNQQYGLTAYMNLFQFGKGHYNYLSQNSFYEAEKLENKVTKIKIENKYLLTLFKKTLLQKKLALYTLIENLKRKGLKVAQQRFNRGNLPKQQVDKVEIDLNNLMSEKNTTERQLLDSEIDIAKFQLTDFKTEWPFTTPIKQRPKTKKADSFIDINILKLKSEAYAQQLESSRRNYLPKLDLQGSAYQWRQDHSQTQEWDLSLKVTWPLWDNYSRRITNLTAYKDFQYWETEKTRLIRDWDKKIQAKDEQFAKLITQLNQSAENLKKLNTLYTDTEALFSQGRITVNELFQDQQLLFETQINNENELYAFHEFILNYCEFYSERIWDCFQ